MAAANPFARRAPLAHTRGLRRRWEDELARGLGGEADVLPTGDHPLVHARFERDRALPTVTISDHLDVQPAAEPEWRSEPFRPACVVELVRSFVRRRNPDVRVEAEHALEPFRGHTTGPHVEAIRSATQFAFGRATLFVREGGSIGAVGSMARVRGAPVHFLGLSLSEHGCHAPDECFDGRQGAGGMAAFARYIHLVAAG